MARLIPTDSGTVARNAGERAEHDTLRALGESLPNDYTIFHGVHWADESDRSTPIGELDFVVVNRSGDVLFVEQKAGELTETDSGLVKFYGNDSKPVATQVHRALEGIKRKWSRTQSAAGPLDVGYLLYLPDYGVMDVNAAGLATERIVHAGSEDGLAARIDRILGKGVKRDPSRQHRILGFFRQQVNVVPSLDHAMDTQRKVYERLSEGIVRLGERLEMEPWRLRVVARAGSGKSQLAMRTVERAVARGRRTLYVCFNRPLAERVQATLEGATVESFHGFCRTLIESRGRTFEMERAGEPDFWREVEQQVGELVLDGGPAFETLVVDEGQDFEQEWFEILQLCLADEAEILWVEDPMQNLGQREPVQIPDCVTYRTDENHRSPPTVIRAIQKWLGVACTSENDLPGGAVECYPYLEAEEQRGIIDDRIRALVAEGYAPEDIVILTVHGFQKSAFSGVKSAGGYPLRRFAEKYAEDGQQIYTTGRILFDSIYRFKGQQAPAVILTDIDFDDWQNDRARQVLYTGMTRATRHLELHRAANSSGAK